MTQHIVYVPEAESAAFIQYVEAHGYAYEPVEADTEDIPEWQIAEVSARVDAHSPETDEDAETVIAELLRELK